MSPAEIVNTAEFHVYERALYKVRWRLTGALALQPGLSFSPGLLGEEAGG